MIHLPDTSFEAFELFVKILYGEPADLATFSPNILDHLYNLADKYLVFEMKESIMDALRVSVGDALQKVQDIEIMLSVTSENPVKEALTELVVQFLDTGIYNGIFSYISVEEDFSFLATAYYSDLYSDRVREAIVRGFGSLIFYDDNQEAWRVLARIPQSENNSKFIHMLIQNFFG